MQQEKTSSNESIGNLFPTHQPRFKPPFDSPTPLKRKGVSAVAEGVQRKVSSIDQMAQFNSYYNVKGFGSQKDSAAFMAQVQRRKSIVGTFLLPMVVTSGCTANTANQVADRIVRNISVTKLKWSRFLDA